MEFSHEPDYGREFFDQYGVGNPAYRNACRAVGKELYRRFLPDRVIDWGCGAALHAGALADCGAQVTAVDRCPADPDQREPGVRIVHADLRSKERPPGIPATCDLSICIDVLEHIDECFAQRALEHIVHGAGVVILSCAPKGQGGHQHVNEQPRRYWIAKMEKLGWFYDRGATGALEDQLRTQRDEMPWSWMYHNLCVYRPTPSPGRRQRSRPVSTEPPCS